MARVENAIAVGLSHRRMAGVGGAMRRCSTRHGFALVFCAGCTRVPYTDSGWNIDEFFPFDGERTWEFVNDDPEIAYHVVATLDSEPRLLEGGAQRAYTIRYSVDCLGGDDGCVTGDPFRIRSLTMSSDLAFGTRIHDVDTVETGSETFDPPIVLTGNRGSVGDVWESESGGVTWASTFTSFVACDVPYTAEWDHCIDLDLDGEPDHPLQGSWTAAPGYNLVVFQWRDDPQPWRLLTQSWTPPD